MTNNDSKTHHVMDCAKSVTTTGHYSGPCALAYSGPASFNVLEEDLVISGDEEVWPHLSEDGGTRQLSSAVVPAPLPHYQTSCDLLTTSSASISRRTIDDANTSGDDVIPTSKSSRTFPSDGAPAANDYPPLEVCLVLWPSRLSFLPPLRPGPIVDGENAATPSPPLPPAVTANWQCPCCHERGVNAWHGWSRRRSAASVQSRTAPPPPSSAPPPSPPKTLPTLSDSTSPLLPRILALQTVVENLKPCSASLESSLDTLEANINKVAASQTVMEASVATLTQAHHTVIEKLSTLTQRFEPWATRAGVLPVLSTPASTAACAAFSTPSHAAACATSSTPSSAAPRQGTHHYLAELYSRLFSSSVLAFIDLKSAFDVANRDIILDQLVDFEVKEHLLKGLTTSINSTTTRSATTVASTVGWSAGQETKWWLPGYVWAADKCGKSPGRKTCLISLALFATSPTGPLVPALPGLTLAQVCQHLSHGT
ncbi:hypothetical protein O3P69_013882 [Scylla paramamosain]|uniref:Reverse transcriptase domain-containing protein n=1 Tax=Scylla paramamosain TaxID=85552 RepID=A0AAW0SRD5_SCYPA